MTEFWSVSFYFVILKILDDIYDRAIAIVVGIVFVFALFGYCGNLFFDKEMIKI